MRFCRQLQKPIQFTTHPRTQEWSGERSSIVGRGPIIHEVRNNSDRIAESEANDKVVQEVRTKTAVDNLRCKGIDLGLDGIWQQDTVQIAQCLARNVSPHCREETAGE